MLINLIIFYGVIFLLGEIAGSFVGALTWRVHTKRDWVRGRSECEKCHHKLSVLDLVPIFSFLCLKGKCRYCHKPIGQSTIWLELLTGLSFSLSVMFLPSALMASWQPASYFLLSPQPVVVLVTSLWLLINVLFVALAIYDIKWGILPDKFIGLLVGLGFIFSAICHLFIWQHDWLTMLGTMSLGLLPICGVYGVIYIVSQGRHIGFGDVKYGLVVAVLLPWWSGLGTLFLANLLASIAIAPRLITKKMHLDSELAFGPFLIVATYIFVLFGWQIMTIFN